MMTQVTNGATNTAVPQQTLEQIRSNVKFTLEQVMGDSSAATLDEMSSIFLEDAFPMLKQMKDALISQDHTAMKMAAHALKGSSATIGLERFASICLAVESSIKEQNDGLLRQNLILLEAEYSQVHQALSAFLIQV